LSRTPKCYRDSITNNKVLEPQRGTLASPKREETTPRSAIEVKSNIHAVLANHHGIYSTGTYCDNSLDETKTEPKITEYIQQIIKIK
jgi:hypothetical protein